MTILMPKPKVVSIFTTTEGHWSISQAICNYLEKKGIKVYVNKHEGFEFKTYRQIYKHRPELFHYFYQLSQNRLAEYMTKRYSQYNYQQALINQVATQKPDAIISCWFFLTPILQHLGETEKKPVFNVVANPRTIHPMEITPHTQNIVFDKHAAKSVTGFTEEKLQTYPLGWFVREEFEKKYDREKLREFLFIRPDEMVLLIQGGSEGTNRTLKILKNLAENPPENTHILFIAGRNKQMYNKASKYANSQIEVLGYTNRMATYLQTADLVIGKAGPNVLFESVATHTPFLATNHIAGQEDGNLDIIRDYKVGFVEEEPDIATELIQKLIREPQRLVDLKLHIEKLAAYNHQSKIKLLELLNQK